MNITILGGAGFIGSRLSQILLNEGHNVKIIDTFIWGFDSILSLINYDNFYCIKQDIRDPNLNLEDADVIVLLAAVVGYPSCDRHPDLAWDVNVNGTQNVVNKSLGKKIIFASTGSVYGELNQICTEEITPNPISLYSETKLKGEEIVPTVTWGTSPEDVLPINSSIPGPESFSDPDKRKAVERSLDYMGLKPKTKIEEITIDKVFIGSCTNGRIQDLRAAAKILKGKKIAKNVTGYVVPGSGLVKKQAEDEGLDKIFTEFGLEWRNAGCSMCLGMNPDQLKPQERCASTSNRNFEGRQGRGGRTHLCSPAMAAAAAVEGKLTDVRKFYNG